MVRGEVLSIFVEQSLKINNVKVNLNLVEVLKITNLKNYKIHLACNNGENNPLDLFYSNYEEWVNWNEYYGSRDDFNRPYILSLIEEYDKIGSYIFAGVFQVIDRIPQENRYQIEEVNDYNDFKGKLRISFMRYQGLRGRAFKLESFKEQLVVSEIIEGNEICSKNVVQRGVPNIFSFATSELSQDAMFVWLLQWADPRYKSNNVKLHELGKSFVRLMLEKSESYEIRSINVGRQWHNIDIWAEINDDTFLVIEDKTGTSVHDDQLNRYKEFVRDEYEGKREQLFFAYVKTENEPITKLESIKKIGYKSIDRQALLDLLREYKGNNNLVIDYREHLNDIEMATNSYVEKKVGNWTYRNWQGFYKELEKHIKVDSWDYVPNPAGGFLGAWWHFVPNDEIRMYLQFEQSKLCIKIEYFGDGNRAEIRKKYYDKLMKKSREFGLEVKKPTRFGAGTYMTIGVMPQENIFEEGLLNLDTLLQKLKNLERLVDECVKI